MSVTIAIDFGTSRTKLAYLNPTTEQPELMRLGQRDDPFIPSLFYLERDSERIFIGDEAEAMLADDPAGVVDVLKRKLHETHVRANRRRETPQALLKRLLADLRERAGREIPAMRGQLAQSLYLTVPAIQSPTLDRVLRAAAEGAGFTDVTLIAEPVAAAQAWLAHADTMADSVVVFDCGGGTIDWAYLRREGGAFRLVAECPPGGDHVGGYDLDRELLSRLQDQLDDEGLEGWSGHEVELLQSIRVVKERYCRGLPLAPIRLAGQTWHLTERDIERAITERFVHQACEGLKSYLDQVRGVNGSSLPPVLLVGGSARLKGLRETIERECGCETAWWDRADYATVLGSIPNFDLKPSQIQNVINHELEGDAVNIIINEQSITLNALFNEKDFNESILGYLGRIKSSKMASLKKKIKLDTAHYSDFDLGVQCLMLAINSKKRNELIKDARQKFSFYLLKEDKEISILKDSYARMPYVGKSIRKETLEALFGEKRALAYFGIALCEKNLGEAESANKILIDLLDYLNSTINEAICSKKDQSLIDSNSVFDLTRLAFKGAFIAKDMMIAAALAAESIKSLEKMREDIIKLLDKTSTKKAFESLFSENNSGSKALPGGRYRDNSDGTVTDVETGLQWMRCSLGQEWKGGTCVGTAEKFTWEKAMEAAEALNHQGGYAGYRDWRLPTKKELLSLVYCSSGEPHTWNKTGKPCKYTYDRPTINQSAFPNTPANWFWSASPDAYGSSRAWSVYFGNGNGSDGGFVKARDLAVRLVRGGQ